VCSPSLALELGAIPPRRGSEWRRAWFALQELLEGEGADTAKAFEVSSSLDGDYGEVAFQRFLAEPGSCEVLRERPSLVDALSFDRLARLPDQSFGRLVLAHLERNQLDPRTLAELYKKGHANDPQLGDAREWFRLRLVLMHDLWHTLSGYGSDELGETALLWFFTAQTGLRSFKLLSLGAGAQYWKQVGRRWPGYVAQAWRRGRCAVGFLSLPYEKLLPEPLDLVRGLAGIAPPSIAHPHGILRLTQDNRVERTSPDLAFVTR
jgi:ubiquinone biosynthesis protein COQ4